MLVLYVFLVIPVLSDTVLNCILYDDAVVIIISLAIASDNMNEHPVLIDTSTKYTELKSKIDVMLLHFIMSIPLIEPPVTRTLTFVHRSNVM